MGETVGIPFTNLVDFPSVLHPEGLRFLGVQQGWFAHYLNHTFSDLGIQEVRMSRNSVIWIIDLNGPNFLGPYKPRSVVK